MIGVADYDAAAQVEEAQVAAFNHRPPHLINGHAELKLVRDPHWFTIGAHRFPRCTALGLTIGRRMGLASGCFHSKFRSCGCKLGMMVAAGNLLVMVTFSLWDPLIPISCWVILSQSMSIAGQSQLEALCQQPVVSFWSLWPAQHIWQTLPHYLEEEAYLRQSNCCDRITVKTQQSWSQSATGEESAKVFVDKSYGRRLDGLVGLLAQL